MPECKSEIPGFPGYYASTDGSIWSAWGLRRRAEGGRGTESFVRDKLRELSQVGHPAGYLQVSLRKEGKYYPSLVHRLILLAFVGPCPEGMECCHGDGDKHNNRLGNLRWGTRQENMNDSVRLGTTARGERDSQAKLTDEEVLEIVKRLDTGEGQVELATIYGISQTGISFIALGKTWRHLTGIGVTRERVGVDHLSKGPRAAEIYERIAVQNRGKKHSEEHKKKITEGLKRRWAKY